MKINKTNALKLWEMCFGEQSFAEDFHGYLMCKDGYGDSDYYVYDKHEKIYCGWNLSCNCGRVCVQRISLWRIKRKMEALDGWGLASILGGVIIFLIGVWRRFSLSHQKILLLLSSHCPEAFLLLLLFPSLHWDKPMLNL